VRAARRRALLGGALALFSTPSQALSPKSSGPARGTLLPVGGGTTSAAVIDAAQRYAGGSEARWIVIPSAQTDRQLELPKVPDFIRDMGRDTGRQMERQTGRAAGRFSLLHTRDRAVADSEAFVAPLHEATAVWIEGGRQWRLADTYGGTRTEQALRELLERGGLVAGSSAGATIMGSYLVRGSPSGSEILMAPGHERGFGFLHNVAIDQHIAVRHRESDLARVVAAHSGLLGIGIDEGTAILVHGDVFTVVGPSIVAITDGTLREGRPYYTLRQGARFDLASWSVLS
jgi:cyanophycinase